MIAALLSTASVKPCDNHPERCATLQGALPETSMMPLVALGTWRGSYKDCPTNNYTCVRERAASSVGTWLTLSGGTHIDTANDYRTQVEIAEALRAGNISRDQVFLTTKCPGALGMAGTIQCAEDNLQMLGQYGVNTSGYIDLLLIHFPFVIKPRCYGIATAPECSPEPFYDPGAAARQETWKAMELLQGMGRARAIGISDYNSTHIAETLKVATKPIALHQVEWNPLQHDEAMLALCQQHGIQLQAWSPLGGAKGSVFSNPTIKAIAAAHNVSAAQVAIKWSLARGVAVVVGTDNPAHMASDLDVWGFTLSEAEVSTINQIQRHVRASPPRVPRT